MRMGFWFDVILSLAYWMIGSRSWPSVARRTQPYRDPATGFAWYASTAAQER